MTPEQLLQEAWELLLIVDPYYVGIGPNATARDFDTRRREWREAADLAGYDLHPTLGTRG